MVLTSVLVLSLLGPASAGNPDVSTAKAAPRADLVPNKVIEDITGYYVCEGQEGPGKKYKGVVVITRKKDVFVMQWVVGGGVSFHGVGLREGNTLSASWAITTDKGVLRGVNVYQIEEGPRLVGKWAALPSDGFIRTETLTFLKKMDDE